VDLAHTVIATRTTQEHTGRVRALTCVLTCTCSILIDVTAFLWFCNNATTLRAGQDSFRQYERANSYAIEACGGMDVVGLLAFAVAAEKINEENLKKNIYRSYLCQSHYFPATAGGASRALFCMYISLSLFLQRFTACVRFVHGYAWRARRRSLV
jgi:hypothetical protein